MLFANNMEINSLYASKDATYHSVYTRHAVRVHSFSNLTFHPLFGPLDTPPSPIFHASSGFPFSPIYTHPILRGSYFFFTRPPSPLYTRYAYILQLVVKHRVPSLPPPSPRGRATATPFGHERYHGLWAGRGLYRLAINRQEITIEIRNACPRVKVAYERRAGT